jgi:hypothetical protein
MGVSLATCGGSLDSVFKAVDLLRLELDKMKRTMLVSVIASHFAVGAQNWGNTNEVYNSFIEAQDTKVLASDKHQGFIASSIVSALTVGSFIYLAIVQRRLNEIFLRHKVKARMKDLGGILDLENGGTFNPECVSHNIKTNGQPSPDQYTHSPVHTQGKVINTTTDDSGTAQKLGISDGQGDLDTRKLLEYLMLSERQNQQLVDSFNKQHNT